MYVDVQLSFCVVMLTYVSGLHVTDPHRNRLQTDDGQLWPSKHIPQLWTDFRRTMDRSSVREPEALLPTPLTSWLHFPNSRLDRVKDDHRYFDNTVDAAIGPDRQDIIMDADKDDEGTNQGVTDHVLDSLGVKPLRLDQSSDRQTHTEINSLDVTQRDIDLTLDSWHGNDAEPDSPYFVRPVPWKRGYNDITPHYDESVRFRSWRRDSEFRLNRFHPSSLRRRLRRPSVAVTVDGTTLDQDVFFTQNITPEPEMSVFRALMSAALTFRRHRAGAENPFNVILDWDYENDCEAIVGIFGMSNSDRHLWRINVRRRRGQVVYRGVCFPPERVLVRPGTRVTIQYS